MVRLRRMAGWLLMMCVGVSALSACDVPGIGDGATASPAPGATATLAAGYVRPGHVPSGWQVFSDQRFALAYPPDWSYSYQSAASAGGGISYSVVFASETGDDQVTVTVTTGLGSAEACGGRGASAQFAGLPMRYQVVEGVHRTWTFVSRDGASFQLEAFDGTKTPAVKQSDAAVLTTFTPADRTSGCS